MSQNISTARAQREFACKELQGAALMTLEQLQQCVPWLPELSVALDNLGGCCSLWASAATSCSGCCGCLSSAVVDSVVDGTRTT